MESKYRTTNEESYGSIFFTSAFGKILGLNPQLVQNIYNTMVRPILTYGALVWGPKVASNKSQVEILSGVQRLACIGITGALRTAPSTALELITGLMPVDKYLKKSALTTTVRLKNTGNWKTSWWEGHTKSLDNELKKTGLRDPLTDYSGNVGSND